MDHNEAYGRRSFALQEAERALQLAGLDDPRARSALDAIKRWLDGRLSAQELAAIAEPALKAQQEVTATWLSLMVNRKTMGSDEASFAPIDMHVCAWTALIGTFSQPVHIVTTEIINQAAKIATWNAKLRGDALSAATWSSYKEEARIRFEAHMVRLQSSPRRTPVPRGFRIGFAGIKYVEDEHYAPMK